ncbi:MAG TPA: hypothetical protein VFL04_00200 [Rectinemataceae bacterium]|nr:hypothetical protein [Rectinemataceae bacterium]
MVLEGFVDGLDFLARRERHRIRLAGGEILDNLVRHSAPLAGGSLSVRVSRRRTGIVMAFFFRSPKFAAFAARCSDPEPLFDPAHRRWRGIGMVMCRNLSSSMRLRPGRFIDRIFLSFRLEPDAHTDPAGRPGMELGPEGPGQSTGRARLAEK